MRAHRCRRCCVPVCVRNIKPAVILENLVAVVDIDGNRSGKALGLSRAWTMWWRGKGSGRAGITVKCWFSSQNCAKLPRLLADAARRRGMAGSRNPAAQRLKAAATVGCATLIHPSCLSRSLLGVQIGGFLSTVILPRKYICETVARK